MFPGSDAGEDRIFRLPEGQYTLEAEPASGADPLTYLAPQSIPFSIAGPWTGPPVTLLVTNASVLRGRCLVGGAVPSRARMLQVRSTAQAPALRLESLLDEQGRFCLTLPDARRGETFEVFAVNVGVLGAFTAPGDGSDVVIDLSPSSALTLRVRARDVSGRGVPSQWTSWEREPPGAPGWTLGPSADGESIFWPLVPGTYRATVTLWDGTQVRGEPFVLEKDGQVVEVRCGP